jgi:hypothetical protein
MAFLFGSLAVDRSVGSRTAGALPLQEILLVAWVWACVFVPIFTSYDPKPGVANPRDLDRAAINPARWFGRDAAGGGGYCLLLWAATLFGAFAAVTVALATRYSSVTIPAFLKTTPVLGLALIIYALSIVAYSACGTVLAVVHRSRREVALATVLLILFMNSAAAFAAGVHLMRKVPRAAPAVLASPAAAGSTVLARRTGGSFWRRYRLEEGFAYGIGYSLLLLGGAHWYYRRGVTRAALRDEGTAQPELPATEASS